MKRISKRKKRKLVNKFLFSFFLLLLVYLSVSFKDKFLIDEKKAINSIGDINYLNDISDYDGEAYVYLNNNVPNFTSEEINTNTFEIYSDLDSLGRCGVAFANVSKDTMPTDDRESIGNVKPSGWHTVKYDIVSGKYLYNRCHLVGYQ